MSYRSRAHRSRKIWPFTIVCAGVLALGLFLLHKQDAPSPHAPEHVFQETKPAPTTQLHTSLFMPYWTSTKPQINLAAVPEPENLLFFAVSPDTSGTLDVARIERAQTDSQHTWHLTISMQNEEISTTIFSSQEAQNKLFSQTIELAHKHGFSGIILDLEHSVIPTTDTRNAITSFASRFANVAHKNNLTFGMTIYGDTLYRARPYNIRELSQHTDMLYIMAYDFHKTFATPGPNFPISIGTEQTYPYSLKLLLQDMTALVPPSKLTILLGLFGYDWIVDSQDRPLKPAHALTLRQLTEVRNGPCPHDPCRLNRDTASGELKLTYPTDDGYIHTIWGDDPTSIQKKIKLIQSYGISQIGFWANGY